MKFYKRNPDAALGGMTSLTMEQRGAYNSLIDLLYMRDGVVRDDDHEVAHAIACDLRHYRRLKIELMAAGKVRSRDGFLRANGVGETILRAELLSSSQRARAQLRWKRDRIANEINSSEMRPRTAIQYTDIRKKEAAEETKIEEPAKPDHKFGATGALEAVVKAKGWT